MSDPTRLGDPQSNSPEILRRLIRAGRSDVPDTTRLHGVADRLGFGVGAATAGAAGAKGAAAGLAISATKIGAAVVLVVGAVAGVLAMSHFAKAPPSVVSVIHGESAATRLHPTPSQVTVAAPSEPWEPLPAPPPPLPPSQVQSGGSPVPTRPADGLIRSVRAAASTAPPPDPPDDTEFSLLEQAQRSLRESDPARALEIADRAAHAYPAGALAQEREVIAVEALDRLGRRSEARARAGRFFRAFPGSAHGPRLRSMLEFDGGDYLP